KFEGKADEGFLVGYSVNSKAFRVFNIRTTIVQETLHINFLENKPNVAGISPKWMFDIDTLTQSMNYQPVVVGNQPHDNAGIKENLDADDAAFDVKENEKDVHVFLVVVTSQRNMMTRIKEMIEERVLPSDTAVNLNFRIAGKSLFIDPSNYPDDPDMPALKDIVYSDDEEDVGAEADFLNLETNISVSHIPTTRVYKDYHVTQIIGDLTSAPQTRSMARMVKEQEPKRVHQELKDPSWIEAMREELLQFKMQKVWVLVDLPKGKRAIGSKWVFRNKKDEREIVIRNKARLVTHGHTQEEGIDYDEVFDPVARIEAIRLFLAYASFMGFMVYKVVKALYGLHQAPKAWYETLTNYLLENGFLREKIDQNLFIKKQKDLKSASTPIEIEKPLLKDSDGEDVDVHIYRKSTTGGCQFLGCRLISWQCKKQTVVATSSTEAEYVAIASCCAQLEPGTFTSIFKFPALKQLAIKRWDEYGFVIHPGLVGVTCKSVRIDL
nr:hypothetical protein [Tanacetum cinerariifolium]